jgi:drug/metabolite transporter (DMT)-like permease
MMSVADTARGGTAAGALSMLAAMAVIGLIDNAVALIARDMGLWQFQLVRGLICLPLLAAAAVALRQPIRAVSLRAVTARSAVVTVAMSLYFGALAFLPIEQALAGLFTSPIWILVITALALRRPVGRARVAAVALGFLGLIVVLEPDPAQLSPVILMPVLGGAFYAVGMIATNTICARENALTLLTGMILCQIALSAVALALIAALAPEAAPGADGFLLRGWTWELGAAGPWLLVQAVGSLVGVGLIIRAYQLGEPSYIAPFEYAAFISGPFFAWALFGHLLGVQQLIGIVLIAAAGTLVALRMREAG